MYVRVSKLKRKTSVGMQSNRPRERGVGDTDVEERRESGRGKLYECSLVIICGRIRFCYTNNARRYDLSRYSK